jgi:hypothetical protein
MAGPDAAKVTKFREAFSKWAGRVRRGLAIGLILTGASAGMAAGAGVAAVAWKTRQGPVRPWTAAGGLLGAAVGAVLARRRRLNDTEVALYLDGRLGANEAVATAVELGKPAPSSGKRAGAKGAEKAAANEQRDSDPSENPGYVVVLTQAAAALEKATSKQVRARVLRPWHAAVPIAAGAIAYLSWIPLPAAPAVAPGPPGSEQVKIAEVAGLEKVIALAELNARDDAQRERLKKLADDARKLQQKLMEGVVMRVAQADLAKL